MLISGRKVIVIGHGETIEELRDELEYAKDTGRGVILIINHSNVCISSEDIKNIPDSELSTIAGDCIETLSKMDYEYNYNYVHGYILEMILDSKEPLPFLQRYVKRVRSLRIVNTPRDVRIRSPTHVYLVFVYILSYNKFPCFNSGGTFLFILHFNQLIN